MRRAGTDAVSYQRGTPGPTGVVGDGALSAVRRTLRPGPAPRVRCVRRAERAPSRPGTSGRPALWGSRLPDRMVFAPHHGRGAGTFLVQRPSSGPIFRRPAGEIARLVSMMDPVEQAEMALSLGEIDPDTPSPARIYDFWLGGCLVNAYILPERAACINALRLCALPHLAVELV